MVEVWNCTLVVVPKLVSYCVVIRVLIPILVINLQHDLGTPRPKIVSMIIWSWWTNVHVQTVIVIVKHSSQKVMVRTRIFVVKNSIVIIQNPIKVVHFVIRMNLHPIKISPPSISTIIVKVEGVTVKRDPICDEQEIVNWGEKVLFFTITGFAIKLSVWVILVPN